MAPFLLPSHFAALGKKGSRWVEVILSGNRLGVCFEEEDRLGSRPSNSFDARSNSLPGEPSIGCPGVAPGSVAGPPWRPWWVYAWRGSPQDVAVAAVAWLVGRGNGLSGSSHIPYLRGSRSLGPSHPSPLWGQGPLEPARLCWPQKAGPCWDAGLCGVMGRPVPGSSRWASCFQSQNRDVRRGLSQPQGPGDVILGPWLGGGRSGVGAQH